ncbi:MAG: hypothetical protein HYX76_14740 [Acidobacteria bacterium]|nr:hypothetical protein [Acidobacteriota bacterium]
MSSQAVTLIASARRSLAGRRLLPLVVVFLLSLPAVTTRIYASDEIEYFVYLRSVWFDRDLSFDNEYRYFYDAGIAASPGFHETFLERVTETGRRLNFAPVGCALLWVPFYAIGDLVARAARAMGAPVAANGFSTPYVAAIAYGSALYGFAAVILSALVADRLVGHGRIAAVVTWVGTPLLFYIYIAPPMSHAASAFVVALFVWTWLLVRERWSLRGSMALGALAALMGMVREQDVLFAAGPIIDAAWSQLDTGRRDPDGHVPQARQLLVNGLAAAVMFATVYLPQAIAYLVLNGRLGPSQIVARKMSWTSPHATGVLVSPNFGLFLWTPLALIGFAGLVVLAARGARPRGKPASRIAICALAMIALQVYVAGSVESWTVAGAFGQRRFVALTVLVAIGVAAWLDVARRRAARVAVALALALSMWWNLGLMIQFGAGWMDRQRLELSRNAYNSFVLVPRRLPEIAYRYLFDRSSFYRTSRP